MNQKLFSATSLCHLANWMRFSLTSLHIPLHDLQCFGSLYLYFRNFMNQKLFSATSLCHLANWMRFMNRNLFFAAFLWHLANWMRSEHVFLVNSYVALLLQNSRKNWKMQIRSMVVDVAASKKLEWKWHKIFPRTINWAYRPIVLPIIAQMLIFSISHANRCKVFHKFGYPIELFCLLIELC